MENRFVIFPKINPKIHPQTQCLISTKVKNPIEYSKEIVV